MDLNRKNNEIYQNKTWRFLCPCLLKYGDKFKEKFNLISKIAVGIYDHNIKTYNLPIGKAIFLLVDTTENNKYYKDFLDYINTKPYFIGLYNYNNGLYYINQSRCSIIILKVPDNYDKAYDKFLEGKYSNMYTEEDLHNIFFIKKEKQREYNILCRSIKALNNFTKQVNKEFNTKATTSSLIKNEYELPLKLDEEIFNCITKERIFFDINKDKNWD